MCRLVALAAGAPRCIVSMGTTHRDDEVRGQATGSVTFSLVRVAPPADGPASGMPTGQLVVRAEGGGSDER